MPVAVPGVDPAPPGDVQGAVAGDGVSEATDPARLGLRGLAVEVDIVERDPDQTGFVPIGTGP